MNIPYLATGIKLIIGILLVGGAYYVVNQSNFDYLFIPNLFLLIGLALLFEGFFLLVCSLSKRLAKRKTSVVGRTRATFIVLFIADLIIRLTGIMQTYSEEIDGNYFSIAKQEKLDSWYWLHTPNTVINNRREEYEFKRNVNSLGLSEREIHTEKGTKFRVLAIGDSFTEGVGVDYNDVWVKQMETRWKSHNVQSINAGIGGSDPVFEFALYRDKMTAYKPDLVVLTINSTDLADIAGRGGFDRFHADGTAGKEPPSWEWVYASNHLFRMIMHAAFNYNPKLIRNAKSPENQHKSVKIIEEAITKFRKLTKKEGSELLVVLQPSLREFENGKHTPFFGQAELAQFLETEAIHYVDASVEFKKKGKSVAVYYYPLDAHFNKKGYALFGETICKKIEELGLLKQIT
jgi:lysophospholipase L1-like esterase